MMLNLTVSAHLWQKEAAMWREQLTQFVVDLNPFKLILVCQSLMITGITLHTLGISLLIIAHI